MDEDARPTAGPTGIRRRRSRNNEEEDESELQLAGAATEFLHASAPSPRSDSDPTSSAAIGGTDKSAATASKAHTGFTPRVRFSEEVERRPSWSNLRGERGGNNGNKSTKDPVNQSGKRPSTPDLSLDTQAAASGTSILGKDTVLSPKTLKSPESQKSLGSPLSPRSRQRGYSLRSSIFRRNMNDVSEAREPTIEMDEVGPSSLTTEQQTMDSSSPAKKSSDTIVEISPVAGAYPEATLDRPSLWDRSTKVAIGKGVKGIKGVSALPHYQQWIEEKARHGSITSRIKAYYNRSRKFILRIQDIPPTKDGRHIELDAARKKALIDERTGHPYLGNTIRSSRYNAWNFIPRQLFAQFSKLANLYEPVLIPPVTKLTEPVTS